MCHSCVRRHCSGRFETRGLNQRAPPSALDAVGVRPRGANYVFHAAFGRALNNFDWPLFFAFSVDGLGIP